MTAKLRIGIVGFGVVGKRCCIFIDVYFVLETVVVCDRIFEDQGVFEDDVGYHVWYQGLLGENFDFLFVCMTNDMVFEVIIVGLEQGLHVFCEKLLGRDVSDIVWVIVCEKAYFGFKFKYGFNYCYHDSVCDVFIIVGFGYFGWVINLCGVYGKSKFISFGAHFDWCIECAVVGGGIFLDQGIYMVDLMCLFVGEFIDIHSFVVNDYWYYDVEDNVYVLMRIKDGVVVMFYFMVIQWCHRFVLDIILECGVVIFSGIFSGSKSYGAEIMMVACVVGDDQGDPDEEI